MNLVDEYEYWLAEIFIFSHSASIINIENENTEIFSEHGKINGLGQNRFTTSFQSREEFAEPATIKQMTDECDLLYKDGNLVT